MRLKNILKLFIPPIFSWAKNNILPHKHQSNNSLSTIKLIKRHGDSLIVIGNGPSLTDSLRENQKQLMKYDCIVVNHFCETNYYETLKPHFYLIADPAFFGDIDNYSEWLKIKISKFINAFISKTQWEMNLIVPNYANGSRFIEMTKENAFIQVFYYNSKEDVVNHFDSKYKMWDSNFLPPPAQTCLNTCVWLGIFLRYRKIYLIGADTTWIEQLHVDQETNEVYTIDSHFYGKKKVPLYADVEGKIPQKLHDELNCISRALSLYWDLKYYADYAGVQIFNASKYSLIDAYERVKRIR